MALSCCACAHPSFSSLQTWHEFVMYVTEIKACFLTFSFIYLLFRLYRSFRSFRWFGPTFRFVVSGFSTCRHAFITQAFVTPPVLKVISKAFSSTRDCNEIKGEIL